MQQTPNTRESQGTRVNVAMPAAGVAAVVASRPGESFVFDFDLSNSTFSRSENSLVIQADNGASVTLRDYFAVGDESLPNLVLADGSVVAGKDFLAQFSDLDITTAAGPGAGAAAAGGGAGEYADSAGDLIAGIDRLGSLGTTQWARGSEPAVTATGATPPVTATDGAPPAGPEPELPVPPGPGPDDEVVHVMEAVNDFCKGAITTTVTQTKIVVDLGDHAAISVRGSVMHSGSVTDKDASRTAMEYAGTMQINSQRNDSAQNPDLADGDFYKKFFQDETGQGLSKSQVLDPANTIVLELKNGVIDMKSDAVKEAIADALAHNKILVITGAESFSLPNGQHTLGVEGLMMVVQGSFNSSSRVTVEGFVLLEGSYANGAHTDVEGGLAVFGDYSNSGNSTASGAEDLFTILTGETVTSTIETFTVEATVLLANDTDSAGHVLHLNPESLALQDGMDKYFDLDYDQGTGLITITPKDPSGSNLPDDWNEHLSFTYTASDDAGNTSNAATVDINYGKDDQIEVVQESGSPADAPQVAMLFSDDAHSAAGGLLSDNEHDTILLVGNGHDPAGDGAGDNIFSFSQIARSGGAALPDFALETDDLIPVKTLGETGETAPNVLLADMLDRGDAGENQSIDSILIDFSGRGAAAPASDMSEGARMIADPVQGGDPEAEAELMLRMLANTM